MNGIGMVLLGLLMPLLAAAGWLWWIYRSDRFEKEPWDLVLKTAGVGAAAGLISLIFFVIVRGMGPLSVIILVPLHLAGIGGALYLLPYKNAHWNEPFDGLVYGGAAGIGYGLLYTIISLAQSAVLGFRVAIFSIPVYMLSGLIIGHYFSKARFEPHAANKHWARGFMIAGLFLLGIEFALSVGAQVVTGKNMLAGLIAYGANMLGWLFATRAMDESNSTSPYNLEAYRLQLAPTGCPHCGSGYPVNSSYCNMCGQPLEQPREA